MPTPLIFQKRNLLMTFSGPEHLILTSSDLWSSYRQKLQGDRSTNYLYEDTKSSPRFCLIFIN